MERIYFFQPRNKVDGTLIDDFIHCDEKTASKYIKEPNRFLYLGWSLGEFVKAVASQNKWKKDEETGMMLDFDEETKKRIRTAIEQEIEFAKNNPDKTLPRDFTRMGLDGGQIEPRLKGKMGL